MDKTLYYSHPTYELVLNLQRVGQELITLLDLPEQFACEHCFLPKCICQKTDTQTNRNQSERSNTESTSNNEACTNKIKVQVSPTADVLPKSKGRSPAPTTEKLSDIQDKGTLMVEGHTNPRNSLAIIESVRPANLPIKTLQRSCIMNSNSSFMNSSPPNLLNSSSLLNSSNSLYGMNLSNIPNVSSLNSTTGPFWGYSKQKNNTNVVYNTSAKLNSSNQHFKDYYSYFSKV
ncbi:uncharacterized protein LOC123877711 [Maniola jurtina]|uniref:uncharacterized protein LOC123877711 n=1 Tax=Maniola jurtina TaxID=191418 RepID=UPI001E68DF10|nr:uncharacterized protein LOC123877711 [Maniola jurtina]